METSKQLISAKVPRVLVPDSYKGASDWEGGVLGTGDGAGHSYRALVDIDLQELYICESRRQRLKYGGDALTRATPRRHR